MENSKTTRMTQAQAVAEANRCLKCANAPCKSSCPAGVDAPRFIHQIATGDWVGAAETIRASNPLGFVCGEVCPAETLCRKNCNCGKLAEPIRISELQAFVMEKAASGALALHGECATGKSARVAIVGGGPSGIAAAVKLAEAGYGVTLFEKGERLGGVPMEEIPNDRLDKAVMEQELRQIVRDGVEVKLGAAIDAAAAKELAAAYDAIYLACGLGDPVMNVLSTASGCFSAEEFLRLANDGKVRPDDLGASVVVQGGGNTAMDAARTAKKLGAERVRVCYRRSQKEMPAWEAEFVDAVKDGVEFLFQTQVLETVEANHAITGVKLAPVMLGQPGADGRRRPVVQQDKPFTLEASALILATGKEKNAALTAAFAEAEKAGKLFCGGDFVNGGATVVQAVAEGKEAAEAIGAYLAKRA